jgi:hypothetical protein
LKRSIAKIETDTSAAVTLLGKHTNTIYENTKLFVASKKSENKKYMLMIREQNAGFGSHIKTADKYFENRARFRH